MVRFTLENKLRIKAYIVLVRFQEVSTIAYWIC